MISWFTKNSTFCMDRDFFFLAILLVQGIKMVKKFYESVRQQIKKINEQYVSKSNKGRK